jgi:hypothetical protein
MGYGSSKAVPGALFFVIRGYLAIIEKVAPALAQSVS